jgi:hypothetical protein
MVAQLFHRAPQRARTASPLLAYLAGDFADAIARIWPAPHGDFFALPAARRHAVALALAGHARQPLSDADLRRLAEHLLPARRLGERQQLPARVPGLVRRRPDARRSVELTLG